MIEITAVPGKVLMLGRQGENLARKVIFSVSGVRAEFGDGAFRLSARRAGESNVYPAAVTENGDTVEWSLTAADTQNAGRGQCELAYYAGETRLKTWTYDTAIAKSLTGSPKTDPYDEFLDEVNRLAAEAAISQREAKNSENAAKNSEENAKASENAAKTSENNAAEYARAALAAETQSKQNAEYAASAATASGQHAQNAATSATNAANSASAAETHEKGAKDAAAAAAKSAEGLADAVKRAEDAATNAQDNAGKTAADREAVAEMKTAAETAQGNAEKAATAAAGSATSAGESAVAAETSKTGAAEIKAQIDEVKAGIDTTKGEIDQAKADIDQTKIDTLAAKTAAETAATTATEKAAEIADSAAQIAKNAENIAELYRTKADILDVLFRYPRTGKVYSVKVPTFAANPTTVCEKLDDNAGLVCEPSTDTVEGQDDYAEIPLFKWYNCNYKTDKYGHKYPTAIEGFDDAYTTEGNVDVGVIQMAPYVKWDKSNIATHTIVSITDSPRDGYTLWSTAKSNGRLYPYVIHSKYISGRGQDGLLRSLPGLVPARGMSHNLMITEYAKKGEGYEGARIERNTWQIIFILIKYAQKSTQNIFAGTSNYSLQAAASIERSDALKYFPASKTDASKFLVGSRVSVGYGSVSSGTVTINRETANMHKYADSAKITKIEALDDANSAIYLDVETGFTTAPVALNDTLNSPVYISSMLWHAGTTDAVLRHHDGSLTSNTDYKHPYRVQGIEYMVGGYTIASDTVIVFSDGGTVDIYVCPDGTKHTNADATIKASYRKNAHVDSGTFSIGDIDFNPESCVAFPSAKGAGTGVGVGDYWYGQEDVAFGITRECLQCGTVWDGLYAGGSYANCRSWLGGASWNYVSAD